MAGIQEVHDLLVKGKAKMIVGAVQEALDAGCDPAQLLNEGMIGAMDEVGVKFKNGEIFVPEMLVAARSCIRRSRRSGQSGNRNSCRRPS